jgi:hypothetical protein
METLTTPDWLIEQEHRHYFRTTPFEAYREEEIAKRANLEAAFAGSLEKYKSFKLYDWQEDRFVLVRDAVEEAAKP